MAGADEIWQVRDWASAAFTGRKPSGREPAVTVEVVRQDHSVLGFGRSCLDTPIRIGRREFQHGLGTHWLDAAWFDSGFPNGVGNWYCPKDRFPGGLKSLSDACHGTGLKFLLWFEPERVAPGSECPYASLQTELRGLTPGNAYTVECIDDAHAKQTKTISGKELGSDFELRLPKRGSSLLVRYRRSP